MTDENRIHTWFGQPCRLRSPRGDFCLSRAEIVEPSVVGAPLQRLSWCLSGCHLVAAGARPRPLDSVYAEALLGGWRRDTNALRDGCCKISI